MQLTQQILAEKIKDKALDLGFLSVGFTSSDLLSEDASHLSEWLGNGYHAEMKYMENHFEKRINPKKLVEGSYSVISLLYNYFPKSQSSNQESPKIARYAYGRDYHKVLRKKLKQLFIYIKSELAPGLEGRYFIDSGPVLERTLARKAGLGWIGKNSMLIHPKFGSFFFICEMLINIELPANGILNDYCGGCTKCIDACPTNAIVSPKVIDSNKCISYHTIENKNEIPLELKGSFQNWIFGCDICQEVCPWNRKSKPHHEPDFDPQNNILNMTRKDWHNLSEEDFESLFYNSAIKRTKYSGLKRNLNFIS